MKLGSTTPACQGSKKTSISCRPRKYHGAFDGFGVRVGLAGSSSGASTSSDHTISRSVTTMAHQELAAHQVRPGVDLVVAGAGRLLERDLDALARRRTAFSSGVAIRYSSRSAATRALQKIRTMTRARTERDRQHAGARKDEGEHHQHRRQDAPFEFTRHGSPRAPGPRTRRDGCARSAPPGRGSSRAE